MKTSLILLCLLLGVLNISGGVKLFENGKTCFFIRHDVQADAVILYAAKELQIALKKISGTDFAIASVPGPQEIVLETDSTLPSDTVCVHSDGNKLRLTGAASRDVLYAVYSFLQRELGVRWLWPGSDGEFMPEKKAWELPLLDYTYRPALKYRGFHLCGHWRDSNQFMTWMARNFINIHRHGNDRWQHFGFYNFRSAHNVKLPKTMFQKHPEYFAEIQGRRYPDQICFSSPDAENAVFEDLCRSIDKNPGLQILGLSAADNNGYCQCATCAAKGVPTAWFDLQNRLTDRLKVKYPKLKFSAMPYQGMLDIPKNPIRNCEFIEYTTYGKCNIHPFQSNCPRSARLLSDLKRWQATGLPIGNYGYEFDIFRDGVFLPFLSVIDDGIKTGMMLKHRAIITEIPLNPKGGPDEEAFAVKNRLPIYLYARLLWEPQEKMESLLSDYCRTAYGLAAAPGMKDYFLAMNRHWCLTKEDMTILGQASAFAEYFITPELKRDVKCAFDTVDHALGGKKLANVEREKLFYNQWLSLLNSNMKILIPLLKKNTDSAENAVRIPGTSLRGAWTPEALIFEGVNASCEVTISPGVGGEMWTFGIDSGKKKFQHRETGVGALDPLWSPAWSVLDGTMVIPFSALGEKPYVNMVWQIQVKEKREAYPVTGALCFSAATKIHTILWWRGCREREDKHNTAIATEMSRLGWNLQFVDDGKTLASHTPDVYWFHHPEYTNKVPQKNWEKIRSDVRSGAMVVLVSYVPMPLERYFDDPSFQVTPQGLTRGMPLAARKCSKVAPGDWLRKPHDLEPYFTQRPAPPYGVIPIRPEAWRVLAFTSPGGKHEDMPVILVRPYGRGVVAVLGIPTMSPGKLMENLYFNRFEIVKGIK